MKIENWKLKIRSGAGFTLVEVLVVITILAILLAATLATIDPFTQIKKAHDAERKHDLVQIRDALDTYYNDHSCYPPKNHDEVGVPFGGIWLDGSTIYMQKTPQEKYPFCQTVDSCDYYYYQTDGRNCPQWAVLYAKLEITPKEEEKCSAKVIQAMCPDVSASSAYDYCLSVGQIDCDGLLSVGQPNPYTVSTTTTTTSSTTTTRLTTTTTGSTTTSSTTTRSTTTTTKALPEFCPDGYYGCRTSSDLCNSIGDPHAPQTLCSQFGGSYICTCDRYHCDYRCAN